MFKLISIQATSGSAVLATFRFGSDPYIFEWQMPLLRDGTVEEQTRATARAIAAGLRQYADDADKFAAGTGGVFG